MNKFIQITILFLLFVIVILLSGNIYIQYKIFSKLPPTYGEFREASVDKRKKLLLRQPLVHANFNEPVSVDISEPLRVEIENF